MYKRCYACFKDIVAIEGESYSIKQFSNHFIQCTCAYIGSLRRTRTRKYRFSIPRQGKKVRSQARVTNFETWCQRLLLISFIRDHPPEKKKKQSCSSPDGENFRGCNVKNDEESHLRPYRKENGHFNERETLIVSFVFPLTHLFQFFFLLFCISLMKTRFIFAKLGYHLFYQK